MIPIIVLRNHHFWNSLDPNLDLSIDTSQIAKQVKKMFLPSQEIIFVAETHSLHEHRHLSMAVNKARKASIAHELEERGYTKMAGKINDKNRRFVAKNKPYLDSDVLLYEFKKVEDLLGSGLISLSTMHQNAFYADLPQESQGTHVLPVYVLALSGLEPGTTLAQGSLVHAYGKDVGICGNVCIGQRKRLLYFKQMKVRFPLCFFMIVIKNCTKTHVTQLVTFWRELSKRWEVL